MDEIIETDPLAALGEHVAAALGEAVRGFEVAYGELTVTVERDAIVDVVTSSASTWSIISSARI